MKHERTSSQNQHRKSLNSFYLRLALTTINAINSLDTQYEALESPSNTASEHGEQELQSLSLLHVSGERQTMIAMEKNLVRLVMERANASVATTNNQTA